MIVFYCVHEHRQFLLSSEILSDLCSKCPSFLSPTFQQGGTFLDRSSHHLWSPYPPSSSFLGAVGALVSGMSQRGDLLLVRHLLQQEDLCLLFHLNARAQMGTRFSNTPEDHHPKQEGHQFHTRPLASQSWPHCHHSLYPDAWMTSKKQSLGVHFHVKGDSIARRKARSISVPRDSSTPDLLILLCRSRKPQQAPLPLTRHLNVILQTFKYLLLLYGHVELRDPHIFPRHGCRSCACTE